MTNLTIYIVVHDKASYNYFLEQNKHIDTSKFKFILVGEYDLVPDWVYVEHIVASFLPDNIEKFKTLLTFTAWYALSMNSIVKTDYVGIFEYDCIFKKDIFELEAELNESTIIGFLPLATSHVLYLDMIPEFCQLLPETEIEIAKTRKAFWSTSTNVIMPVSFMNSFVDWYYSLLPHILSMPRHPHFHERAFNVYAANIDMDYLFFPEYIEHKQLRSHGVEF